LVYSVAKPYDDAEHSAGNFNGRARKTSMKRGFSDTALSRNRAALFCAAELDAGIVICGQHFRKSLGAGVCQGSQGLRQRPQKRAFVTLAKKIKSRQELAPWVSAL